jgi:hypothetical protein
MSQSRQRAAILKSFHILLLDNFFNFNLISKKEDKSISYIPPSLSTKILRIMKTDLNGGRIIMEIQLETIGDLIYLIRGQRVLMDSDLANLYGVETKRLNEQVRRNLERFPEDFMFQLTSEEYEFLKSQFATSKQGSGGKQKLPLVFTENGVAMLSSVLNSKEAVKVNIAIMRIFTKLRSFHMLEKNIARQIGEIKSDTNKIFKIVFERLDDLESERPFLPLKRGKIGLKDK